MGISGLIVGLCLLGSMILSSLYLALIDLKRSTLEELADKRSRAERSRVEKILEDVSGHAHAIALVRVLCNLCTIIALIWLVAGIELALVYKSDEVMPDGIAIEPRHALWALVIGGSLTWIFSVIFPQSLARHAGERLVLSFSQLVRIVHLLLRPLAPIEHGIDAFVRRLVGKKTNDKHAELEAELLSVVGEGEREGQLDQEQAEMIEQIIGLKQTTVGQIMTPRREIEALELTANLGTITAFVRKARHSRIPVYRGKGAGGPGAGIGNVVGAGSGGLDDVVGFFYVKDLLKWLAGDGAGGGKPFDLKSILRPAHFVPETKTVRELAHEFVAKRVHIAMVADEYGGTAGLVTLEDVIEEVFGEIQDEYEIAGDEPPAIEIKAAEYMAEVDARANIEDVNKTIDVLGLSVPEADDYDTLGGFVTTHMGRIPESNESFEVGPMVVTVLESTPMRVVKVRLALSSTERERREQEERELEKHEAADIEDAEDQ